MNSYAVSDLKPDSRFNSDLILDKTFILCSKLCPVSKELLEALEEWKFTEVLCDGTEGRVYTKEEIKNTQEEQVFSEVSFDEAINDAATQKPPAVKSLSNGSVKRAIENAKTKSSAGTEEARLEVVQEVYNEYLKYITSVYTRYATHKEFNIEEISETIKELCFYIKDNKRYILRISPEVGENGKDFLVIHSMRSTVLAITIGLQLRMNITKLVELGIATLLHEIGMLSLPPQLYISNRFLNPGEKAKLSTHPIISYNILKDNNFPLSIQLGVLEHHERENGSGYPRKITSESISSYAKIIAVACSYEAITSRRQYKEEHSSYEAMIELLKNQKHMYDDTVVRALLINLSLFPIGTYVYLSNGKVGIVSDVQPDNPKNPIVQIVGEKNEDGSPKTCKTNDTDLKIVRVMNKQETADVQNAINAQKK